MEESIIEELFNARCDDFEENIMKKEKECNKDLDVITKTFEEILQIVPENTNKIISQKLEYIYKNLLKYSTFWNKKYYKLGINDGIKLKKELKTDVRERKEKEEHFFFDYEADFNDFIENFKTTVLYKNKEYDRARKGISRILEDYPRVRDFYEDDKLYKLDNDELNAILEIIKLEDIQNAIEVRGAFYLGISQKDII